MAKKANKGGKKFPAAFEKMMREVIDKLSKEDPEGMQKLRETFMGPDNKLEVEEVSAKDWALTHPMQLSCPSDKYYASLANDLQRIFLQIPLPPNLPDGFIKETAMSIASYLEDLKSDIGVWNAIRGMYRQKYGKMLPFYDCEHGDYYDDDLNIEDIKLLVWQAFNRCGQPEERVFSPYAPGVDYMASKAYDLLVERFDSAPAATRVRDRIRSAFRRQDYFELRTIGLWLNVDNKLTALPKMREIMQDEASEILNSYTRSNTNATIEQAYYHTEVEYGWLENMSMLGCPTWKMMEALARDYGQADTADILSEVRSLPLVMFKLVRMENKDMILEDGTGEEFRVTRKSIGPDFDPSKVKGGMMRLARFNGEWYQNGIATYTPVEIFFKAGDRAVGGRDHIMAQIREIVAANKGRRLYYCKDEDEVVAILNNVLRPVAMDDSDEKPDNLLLMLSDEKMPAVIGDSCEIISDRKNPYYDGSADREELGIESRDLIMRGIMADDVAEYVQKNRMLPHAFINASQGKKVGKQIVQDNLRFLAGFYRVRYPED